MASLSEHFAIIEAAIRAAHEDGYDLCVDDTGCGGDPLLNLWDPGTRNQMNFPDEIWMAN